MVFNYGVYVGNHTRKFQLRAGNEPYITGIGASTGTVNFVFGIVIFWLVAISET
jgi:hypothetical protein